MIYSDPVAVASSGTADQSAAILKDGRLMIWGCGRYGRLGLNNNDKNQLVPTELTIPTNSPVVEVVLGESFGLAVTADGKVLSWGKGALGRKDKNSRPDFVEFPQTNIFIKTVAAGREHALAVDSNNDLWVWGVGSSYALGNGSKNSIQAPQKISLPGDAKAVAVAAGRDHSLCLTSDGSVFAFGMNDNGQCGTAYSRRSERTPVLVEGLPPAHVDPVTQIAAGEAFSVALTASGKVFTWGSGNNGQLGHGDRADQGTARQMDPSTLEGKVRAVASGGAHLLLLLENGKIQAVGRGREGQLGQGAGGIVSVASYHLLPTTVTGLSTSIVSISAGRNHSLALVSE